MALPNRIIPARLPIAQRVSSLRASITFATLQIGTAGKVPLGTLPAGAIVVGMFVKVTAAFNAATTNVLTVGTAADASAVLAAGDIDESTIATTATNAAVGYQPTSDTTLYIKYAQTGTAATAGAATIILLFVADNDL